MTQETITVLIGSIAGIISAFGIPKIIEAWRVYRDGKKENLLKQLEEKDKKIEALKAEQFKFLKLRIELTAVLPFIKDSLEAKNDADTVEMISKLQERVEASVTPAQT